MNRAYVHQAISLQAAAFQADFEHKLKELLYGYETENMPQGKPSENNDATLDEIGMWLQDDEAPTVMMPQITQPSTPPQRPAAPAAKPAQSNMEKAHLTNRIAALRGCSLPGDYWLNN